MVQFDCFAWAGKTNRFTMETCHSASEGRMRSRIWLEAARLATPAGHPFYERLNRC